MLVLRSAMADAALQGLLDRAAVHDVLLRYARAVDGRDLDAVASCFTADAAYEGALARGAIVGPLAALRAALERCGGTMHSVGNVAIEVTGDTAASEPSAIASPRRRAEARQYVVAVRYRDSFVLRDGRW